MNHPSTSRSSSATNQAPPDRLEINEVASDLVVKYGSMMLKDAIEYSANPSDAEDAYQRSIEIMLTKAPSTDPDVLVPWLRTVVRREARDIRIRQHQSEVSLDEHHAETIASTAPSPESVAESFAVLEVGAEAMGKLTSDQIKCVLAQNEGLEYEEISQLTGFSRRKVTRCLANARIAFANNVEAIAAGSECERIEPLIHRLLDGDTAAAIEVRPHLRHCLACRARLREYENVPRRIAVLFPPALVLVGNPRIGALARFSDWWSSLGDRISTHLIGADRWVEASSAKKMGVVAALATATVGGGVAVHEHDSTRVEREQAKPVEARIVKPGPTRLLDTVRVTRPKPHRRHRQTKSAQVNAQNPAARTAPAHSAPSTSTTPADDGSAEFLPEARGTE